MVVNTQNFERPEEVIECLHHENRYQPQDVQEVKDVLVQYLDEQMQEGFCDFEANLALLELFLINASYAEEDAIHNVLLVALLQVPENQFSLCMYQIHEKFRQCDKIKQLINLSALLEGCKFEKFWEDAANCQALQKQAGWEAKIRAHIVGVVHATFATIDTSLLSSILNCKPGSAEFAAALKVNNWTEKGDKIVVQANKCEEGQVSKEKSSNNGITLDQLSQVLAAASR